MFHRGGGGKPRGFGFSGFSMKKGSGSSGKAKSEDDYFEGGSDSDEGGADRKSARAGRGTFGDEDELTGTGETEEDPLDAFMAGIEDQIEKQKKPQPPPPVVEVKPQQQFKAVRQDIEEEDDQESYFKAMLNAPIVVEGEEEIEIEYDSDGNPMIPDSAKVIDPLPAIDHSEIDYPSFEKNFYEEHPDIQSLSKSDVIELRKKLGLKVSGYDPMKPCVSFAHFSFLESLMNLIRKLEFSQPTPIQAQAVPCALAGRDVIGIAKTGSGKTLAYLWPMLVHCIDQPEIKEGDGPIGLICAPTRELCQQIYHEARKFGKAYNLHALCVYGGGSKWEQSNAVKEGCEILVATPGRLIDLVKLKATNLQRVTFLVFDEADRMFDMGFESQVRSIANHVRPDRQTLLFSATFRKKIERLCRDILTDPVRIVVGDVGEANTDITQIVEVMRTDQDKWKWMLQRMVEFMSAGGVLVFVTRKANSEEVATSLRGQGYQVGLLHGDMAQGDRDKVIGDFKKKQFPILVATDVAARGLDIPYIKTVINFDVAKDIDTHVHRIGRTGRAGEKGTAFTLILPKDVNFAGDLVRNLEAADQNVPEELMKIALQNPRFRKSRAKQQQGGGGRREGRGRGSGGGGAPARYKERPGLGASTETISRAAEPSAQAFDQSGPGGSRASVMKSAMQTQYRMRFTPASTQKMSSTSSIQHVDPQAEFHTKHSVTGPAPSPSDATSEEGPSTKKRKSRWD